MKVNTEVLTDYLNGKCDEKTKIEVKNWIENDEKNRKYYEELRFYRECDHSKSIDLNIDIDSAYNKLVAKKKAQKKMLFRRFMRYAAAAVVIVSIGLVSQLNWPQKNTEVLANLEQDSKEVYLPDGSRIVLQQSSSIEFHQEFNEKKREVILKGEAFFEIAKDKQRPFIVNTALTKTTVLGTSFHISETTNRTLIDVTTGIVDFSDLNKSSNHVRLVKGQSAHFVKNPSVIISGISSQPTKNFAINYLEYKNEKLEQICKNLQEIYNTKIQLEGENIESLQVSGIFENQNLMQILESIAFSLNLTITSNKEYILLKIP